MGKWEKWIMGTVPVIHWDCPRDSGIHFLIFHLASVILYNF
jgi:hypothetical protein